jgi:hypothetical protein
MYNYLFYHTYYLALKSKSNKSDPYHISIMVVGLTLVLNLGTVSILLESIEILPFLFTDELMFVWLIFIIGGSYWYYLINKRHKKIYSKFVKKYPTTILKSIFILLLLYLFNIGLLILTSSYLNKTGVFSN